MNRTPLVAAVLACLAAVLPAACSAAALAPCPADTIHTGCLTMTATYTSADPTLACLGVAPCSPWEDAESCPGGCYDLPGGRLAVALPGGVDCGNAVITEDDYWVTGIPSGAPTLFFAQFRVVGALGDVGAMAVIREGDGSGAAASYGASDSPLDETLVVPLWHSAGEVFRLHLELAAWNTLALDAANLAATLEFADLPGGAAVYSCQGFLQAVPAVPGTWGRVKALYR